MSLQGFVGVIVGCGMLLMCGRGLAQPANAVPEGGTPLIQNIPESLGGGTGASGKTEVVESAGPGFERAMRYTTTKAGAEWDVNTSTPVQHDFKKGEAVLISFWARTISTRRETGQGLVQVHLSEGQSPWRQEAGRFVTFTDQWQQFFAPGQLSRDYPPGRLHLKVFAGNVEQVIEIGGLQLLSYGVGYDVSTLPRTKSTYEGIEPDAAWRAVAERRISELRTAPLAIEVIGRDGLPVPGAAVKAELIRNAFDFATAIDAHDLVRGTEKKHEVYRQKFKELFNAGTFYNHLKWPAWTGGWGDHHAQAVTMDALKWFRANDMAFRGHVMIWPSFRNLPDFMKRLENDPEALQRLCLSHIDEIAAATNGYVQEWDVVNEPYDNHDLMDICGEQVMVDWFKRAGERLPGVRLTLNDYSLLTPLVDTNKQASFEKTVRYLIDNGAPIHVLGLQGHFGGTVPSPERMYATLDRFAKLGKPIRITEYDIGSDEPELKHDFTRDLLITLYSHPAVIGWQTWGIGNIVKEDGSFTPEGEAFNELVHKKWRTVIEDKTDGSGKLQARGHLGRYRVEIGDGERPSVFYIDLRKDSPAAILTLP